jgi:hypothetical protein
LFYEYIEFPSLEGLGWVIVGYFAKNPPLTPPKIPRGDFLSASRLG